MGYPDYQPRLWVINLTQISVQNLNQSGTYYTVVDPFSPLIMGPINRVKPIMDLLGAGNFSTFGFYWIGTARTL